LQTYNLESGIFTPTPKTRTRLDILTEIENRNYSLYMGNIGIPDIICTALRPKADERAASADEILEILDLFDHRSRSRKSKSPHLQEVLTKLSQTLDTSQEELRDQSGPIICNLVGRDANTFNARLKTIQVADTSSSQTVVSQHNKQEQGNLYILRGLGRFGFVSALMTAFNCLGESDEITAVTTPLFWESQNFGPNGRLLTTLKMCALRGITIRWILIVDKDRYKGSDDEAKRRRQVLFNIVASQQKAQEEIHRLNASIEIDDPNRRGFYVGVTELDHVEVQGLIQRGQTFIVLTRNSPQQSSSYTLAAPTYSHNEGTVSSVRFWDNPRRWRRTISGETATPVYLDGDLAVIYNTYLGQSVPSVLYRVPYIDYDLEDRADPIKVRDALRELFSQDDLDDLCHNLSIDPGNLKSDTKQAFSLSLTIHCRRRGDLWQKLVREIRRRRENAILD
jgi:hypothetical protein